MINTNVSSKPCQTSEMELFLQVVTGFRGEPESCQTSKKELFAKNSPKRKAVHYFSKNFRLGCLTRL